jgi:hypothetical protein
MPADQVCCCHAPRRSTRSVCTVAVGRSLTSVPSLKESARGPRYSLELATPKAAASLSFCLFALRTAPRTEGPPQRQSGYCPLCPNTSSQDSSVSLFTSLDKPCFEFRWGQERFPFSKTFRQALGHNQPSVRGLSAALSLVIKVHGREADNSLTWKFAFKSEWSCDATRTVPICVVYRDGSDLPAVKAASHVAGRPSWAPRSCSARRHYRLHSSWRQPNLNCSGRHIEWYALGGLWWGTVSRGGTRVTWGGHKSDNKHRVLVRSLTQKRRPYVRWKCDAMSAEGTERVARERGGYGPR